MLLPSGVVVPCGKCLACRLNSQNIMTMRCIHESSAHEHTAVATLTYSDDYCPDDLKYDDFKDMWDKIRWSSLADSNPKFVVAGEYGETYGRPHFHCILFGFDPVKLESELPKYWKYGFIKLDRFSCKAAAYTVKYLLKDNHKQDVLHKVKPFVKTSRGLGRKWIDSHMLQVIHDGCIYYEGTKMAIPPYYLQRIRKYLNHGSTVYVPVDEGSEEDKRFRSRLAESRLDLADTLVDKLSRCQMYIDVPTDDFQREVNLRAMEYYLEKVKEIPDISFDECKARVHSIVWLEHFKRQHAPSEIRNTLQHNELIKRKNKIKDLN